MDDPISNFDQTQAAFMATVPQLWKCLFDRLKEEGFAEHEAIKVLTAYVHGSAGGKYN